MGLKLYCSGEERKLSKNENEDLEGVLMIRGNKIMR